MSLPALSTTNDVCKRKKKILDIQRHMVQLSSENWFTAGNFQCQIRITQRMKTHKRKDLKRILPNDKVGLSQEYKVGLTFVKQIMLFTILPDYKIKIMYHNWSRKRIWQNSTSVYGRKKILQEIRSIK